MAYLLMGRYDEAIDVLKKGSEHVVFAGWGDDVILLCLLRKGDRAGAERIMAKTLEARKSLPVSAVTLAYGLAALGDLDGAFEWLETAVRDRDSVITVFNVYTECVVPELARDPRFGALLDRLGLPR
jgi:tetratricopeptide (TPR) repeat protein